MTKMSFFTLNINLWPRSFSISSPLQRNPGTSVQRTVSALNPETSLNALITHELDSIKRKQNHAWWAKDRHRYSIPLRSSSIPSREKLILKLKKWISSARLPKTMHLEFSLSSCRWCHKRASAADGSIQLFWIPPLLPARQPWPWPAPERPAPARTGKGPIFPTAPCLY